MLKKMMLLTAAIALAAAARGARAEEGAWSRARMTAFWAAADTAPASVSASHRLVVGRAGSRSVKSARLAGLLSATVPGAGELYAGSWPKAAVFAAVEAGAWIEYARFTDRGNERRLKFRAYADAHWSRERWESRPNPDEDPMTHELPAYETQQYYEMIGKYNEFMKGWDDWRTDGPKLTPNRFHYETMRHNHNAQLINASRCGMIALGNHLLSALDAAWTAHRRNVRLSLRIDPETFRAGAGVAPVFAVSAAW
jgi:hypothetical protein